MKSAHSRIHAKDARIIVHTHSQVEKAAKNWPTWHGCDICPVYMRERTIKQNHTKGLFLTVFSFSHAFTYMQMLFVPNINLEKWFSRWKWIQFIRRCVWMYAAVERISWSPKIYFVYGWMNGWMDVNERGHRLCHIHTEEMRRKLWFMLSSKFCLTRSLSQCASEWVSDWVNKLLIHFDVVRKHLDMVMVRRGGCFFFFYLFLGRRIIYQSEIDLCSSHVSVQLYKLSDVCVWESWACVRFHSTEKIDDHRPYTAVVFQ